MFFCSILYPGAFGSAYVRGKVESNSGEIILGMDDARRSAGGKCERA